MDVAPLHQTECLASIATHVERLAVELADEGVKRAHDIADGAISMIFRMGSGSIICLLKYSWIRFFHHLLAEVNADQVLLEDVVVEHVLRRLTQIDNPLT